MDFELEKLLASERWSLLNIRKIELMILGDEYLKNHIEEELPILRRELAYRIGYKLIEYLEEKLDKS